MLGKRITGHDEDTSRIVQHNLNGEHGRGYVIDVHDRIVASLAPGKDLQQTTKAILPFNLLQHTQPRSRAKSVQVDTLYSHYVQH